MTHLTIFTSRSHQQVAVRADRLKKDSAGMWDIGEARAALKIEEELLLVGWVGDRFRIYRYFYPHWQECDPFASIGYGTLVAEAMLNAREWSALRPAHETAYRVYEAQRMGSIVPSVGTKADLVMLTHEKEYVVSRDIRSDDMLEKLWDRFGFHELKVDFRESDFDWGEPY